MSVWHEWLRGRHSAKQGDESVALHVHRPRSEGSILTAKTSKIDRAEIGIGGSDATRRDVSVGSRRFWHVRDMSGYGGIQVGTGTHKDLEWSADVRFRAHNGLKWDADEVIK
jgi:hypothetical protein